MKAILIFFLLSLSFSYDGKAASNYAKKYCNNYNPKYHKYETQDEESANFVSQCMAHGGQDFEGCKGKDDKGMFKNYLSLKECLISKGWKITEFPKKGAPAFSKHGPYALIITDNKVERNQVTYCSHELDRCEAKFFIKGLDIYTNDP